MHARRRHAPSLITTPIRHLTSHHSRGALQVTASALVAAEERWPQLFAGVSPEREREVLQLMRRVRPVLVRCGGAGGEGRG